MKDEYDFLKDIRGLFHMDRQRRQALLDSLKRDVEKGRSSGKPKPAAEVLNRLQSKYAGMAKGVG
jgi:hypothetical protein